MQKIYLTAILASSILTACAEDPLQDIKQAKIKGHNLTWAEAAEQFEYCQEGTQQWQLKDAQHEDRQEAVFTCNLNEKSINPINAQIQKAADEAFAKEKKRIEERTELLKNGADGWRKGFKETYAYQCQDCTILDGKSDEDIDALALSYYEDRATQNPTIQALNEKLVMLDTAFFNLGDQLHQLSQIQQPTPTTINPVTGIGYTLEIIHWTDEQRIQYHGEEFSDKEYIIQTFADGQEKRAVNPLGAKYLINNENPVSIFE